MNLNPIQRGQSIPLTASTWNVLMEMARHYQKNKLNFAGQMAGLNRQTGIVRVRNSTGGDLDRGNIIGIDAPLIEPTANEREFQNTLAFNGVVTSTGTGTIRVKSKVSWFNGISLLELLGDEFIFVQLDQHAAEGIAIVPVAESDFVLPDVSTPVLFVLRNIDDVSSVAIGPNNGGVIEPFLALGPGELTWFRLADSVTIRWHSDIDDCLIQYLVLGA